MFWVQVLAVLLHFQCAENYKSQYEINKVLPIDTSIFRKLFAHGDNGDFMRFREYDYLPHLCQGKGRALLGCLPGAVQRWVARGDWT